VITVSISKAKLEAKWCPWCCYMSEQRLSLSARVGRPARTCQASKYTDKWEECSIHSGPAGLAETGPAHAEWMRTDSEGRLPPSRLGEESAAGDGWTTSAGADPGRGTR